MNELFSVFGQMNLDILYYGIDSLPKPGEEVFARGFDIQLGGGPMLYPIILKRLGIKSRLGTFIGKDTAGWIAKKLLEENDFYEYTDFYHGEDGGPVVVTSVLSHDKDRSFICYNEEYKEALLTDEEVYNFLKDSKATFTPHGKLEVIKKLHQDGVKLIFDTGWYDDLSLEKYKETLPYVDIFTPNDKEALKMTACSNIKDACKKLAEFVKHPIISLGEEGCITYIDDKLIHVPLPKKFNAVDTTGAGDNFLAGIIYGQLCDWDITKSMQMGNTLGGYSTTELGCYKAKISLDEALSIMKLY